MRTKARHNNCLYLLSLVLYPLLVFGQKNNEPFPFHHIEYIGSKQGLNGTEAYWMKQDSRGFMWVITDVALNRYDGYNFQSWSYDANDTNSISQDSYFGLAEDKFGMLWLPSARSGVYSFDPVHQKFAKYVHREGNLNSLLDNSTYYMIGDGDYVWFLSGTALNKFDVVHKSFTNYRFNEFIDLNTANICDIAIDNTHESSTSKKKLYLIGYENGNPFISHFNEATAKMADRIYFPFKEAASRFHGSAPWSISQQRKEIVWMGSTDDGIYGFNMVTDKFVKIPMQHHCKSDWHNVSFYFVLEDHAGNLWTLNDDDEVVYYNNKENKFYFLPYKRKHASLRTFSSFLYEDNNHKIWISNADELMTIDTDEKNIFSLQHDPADPFSIAGNYVCGLNRADDKLFVGTSLGCQVFDNKTKRFYEPAFLRKMNMSETWSIKHDRKNNVWFVGRYGITRYDPSTNTAVQADEFQSDSGIISLQANYGWLEDRRGRFWMSNGRYGLCSFDPTTLRVKTFSFYGPERALASFGPIFIDSRGIIYVEGWESSFITFNTKTDRFKIYKHDPSNPASIRQGWAKGFIETNNGLIWFCSTGGGVGVFDPNTKKFKAFTTENGLINNNAVSMVMDMKGRFWVSTFEGISCFTPPEDPFAENCKINFRNYDVNDGFPSNAFNWASSFCDTDGTLFFGTRSAGLVYFHPDSLKDNNFIPPVYITGFSLLNKPVTLKDSNSVLKESIEFTRQLVFNHSQNTFSFSFAALNYTRPEKNKYAYKLEGFDKDWIYKDASQRFANYTNLGPGEYTFKVKGSNNDGVWNKTPAELKIVITPPFWQTTWFEILVALAVAAIIYSFYRYRIGQILLLQRIRNKIAADLHDDIGSTLNSIALYSDLAKQQPAQRDRALDVIGESARKIIDSMSDIVWMINPKNDSFDKIIFRMRSLTHDLLRTKKIECQFKYDETLNEISLPMGIRRNIYLIFKEALNNMTKYSNATRASVKMLHESKNVILLISDNGIGFDNNVSHNGNGISNMVQRAQEIGAKLNVESEYGAGTNIELNVKL